MPGERSKRPTAMMSGPFERHKSLTVAVVDGG
jgi:hypothetical protein